jgi:hypothetical protein
MQKKNGHRSIVFPILNGLITGVHVQEAGPGDHHLVYHCFRQKATAPKAVKKTAGSRKTKAVWEVQPEAKRQI